MLLTHRLDRYLLAAVLRATVAVFLIMVAVLMTVGWMDELSSQVSAGNAMLLTMCRLPRSLVEAAPFASMMGALLALSTLASQQQLTAMRAAGVRLRRIVAVTCIPGALLTSVGVGVLEWVAEPAEQFALRVRADLTHDERALNWQWLKQRDTFVGVSGLRGDGNVNGVQLWQFDAGRLTAVTRAASAFVQGRDWQLEDVVRFERGLSGVRVTHLSRAQWRALVPLAEIIAATRVKESTASLAALMTRVRAPDASVSELRSAWLALMQRVLDPIASLSLILVGAALVLGPLRDGGLGARLSAGLLVGVVFRYLQNLLTPLAILFAVPPLLAVLTPLLLCFAAGVWMLRRAR